MSEGTELTRQELSMQRFNNRMDELAKRGDIERLRNMGKLVDVVKEIVKGGNVWLKGQADIARLETQRELVLEKTRQAERVAAGRIAEARAKVDSLHEHGEQLRRTIREDIPLLLDTLKEFPQEVRHKAVQTALEKLATLEVKVS